MDVKIVDLKSKTFENSLMDSVTNTGFAVLTNHSIAFDDIREAQRLWRHFFLNEEQYKKFFINKANPNIGYHAMRTEKAVGAKVADVKEHFHWRPGQQIPQDLSFITQHLFYKLESIGMSVLRVLDYHSDQMTPMYESSCYNSDNTILRSLYYPAHDFSKEKDAVRAAAHEDINFITLLVAASAPGLEVKDSNGNWQAVPFEENSVILNIGDMLALASKGQYKSTTHRVINPPDSITDRISLPLFIHADERTVLDKDSGFTAKEFLEQRLKEITVK